jgi:hypothetical protein
MLETEILSKLWFFLKRIHSLICRHTEKMQATLERVSGVTNMISLDQKCPTILCISSGSPSPEYVVCVFNLQDNKVNQPRRWAKWRDGREIERERLISDKLLTMKSAKF